MTPLTQKSSIVLSAHIASIFISRVKLNLMAWKLFINISVMPSQTGSLTRSGEATTITKNHILVIMRPSLITC